MDIVLVRETKKLMEEINRTELGQTWEQIKKIAKDRRKWKFFVIDLYVCPDRG